jgi:hypothetical protein
MASEPVGRGGGSRRGKPFPGPVSWTVASAETEVRLPFVRRRTLMLQAGAASTTASSWGSMRRILPPAAVMWSGLPKCGGHDPGDGAGCGQFAGSGNASVKRAFCGPLRRDTSVPQDLASRHHSLDAGKCCPGATCKATSLSLRRRDRAPGPIFHHREHRDHRGGSLGHERREAPEGRPPILRVGLCALCVLCGASPSSCPSCSSW